MLKKSFFSIFFVLTGVLFASTSNNSEYKLLYREALHFFDNGDYGKAFSRAEDAITSKKQLCEIQTKILSDAIAVRQVRKAGNKIDSVLKVLNERDEYDTAKIISSYVKIKGIDFFENNIQNLISYIKENSDYPEAQKLLGDIYKLEGEYDFAESFYKTALENANVLEIPDEKYEILYQLADLSRLNDDFDSYELRLLNILTEDKNFLNNTLITAMKNTIAQDTKDAVEKFFMLYRADSFYCLKAYNELTEYYFNQNQNEKALNFACLSVITGFTRLYNVINDRDIDFEYSNLGDFFQEIVNFPDVNKWASENEVWKSFNKLSEVCIKLNYKNFAESLLKTIIQFSPDEYWQKNAVLQLSYL